MRQDGVLVTAPTTSIAPPGTEHADGPGGNGAHPQERPDGAATRRWRFPVPTLTAARIINTLVVAAAIIFVFSQLQPHLLFRNTTPSGGDMGAHVWQPAYLRDHLLPHFRLTGWTPDWYAGFPTLVFYFPLPSLAIVVLGVILPYSIAFKLVTVLGLLTLPAAVFAFGRLSGMKDPGPACLAAASLPFLFDRTFTIYGGNIPSTLAGEFAFSISLSLMFLFFGYFARGLQNGRHRSMAAVLLALTGLCHMIPAIFAVGGAALLLLFRFDRHRLKWAVPVFATGGALAGFWAIPFLLRLPYTNDMGWEKIVDYRKTLFPDSFTWVLVLALLGVITSALMRRRTGLFLSAMTVGTAIAFRIAPQGRLWNARLLPFWFLWIWMLVGVLVAELGMFLAGAVRTSVMPDGDPDAATRVEPFAKGLELATPIVAVLGAIVLVGFPLRVLPFGSTGANGKYTWMGITSADRSFIPDWVRWNYSGYEDKGKPRHDEYAALVRVMSDIGKSQGCGRAMWEYEAEEDGFGTPMALMLLPHWTDGCIGSMEGLFFESSATTPYHFLNQSELSERPSRAMRNVPYRDLSVTTGVAHLQMLGVRYYMALTPAAQGQADVDPDLHLLATSGPWTVHYSAGDQQRTWKIYEVAQSDLVAPLVNQPDVMTNVQKGGKSWLAASVSWYQNANRWDVPLAVSGPKDWKRMKAPLDPLGKTNSNDIFGGLNFETPRVPITNPPTISHIKQKDDRISFDVSEVGKPVLVKESYFPNWKASGAKGPYRVTPNQMVVIPTKTHVSLHYGYTPVDEFGWLLTIAGLIGVIVLWRMGPVIYPERPARRRRYLPLLAPAPVPQAEADGADSAEDAYSAALGRQLSGVNGDGGHGPPVDVDSYWD